MTPTEEDALWDECTEAAKQSGIERWRLAIRAAVAQERERAARVCEEQEARWYRTKFQHIATRCAAAIRKGE